MGKSIRVSTKKRRAGRPKTTGKGLLVGLRWHEPLLGQIDEWAQSNNVTRAEAIRRLVEQALTDSAEGARAMVEQTLKDGRR
jgi:hypothetical protein